MTHKEMILNIIDRTMFCLTCAEITRALIRYHKVEPSQYLSGSISSILAKLVKDGILQYGQSKGPRGGNTYERKKI